MESITRYIDCLLQQRLVLHVVYWACVFIFFLIYGLGHGQPVLVSCYVFLVDFPFQIMAYYLFVGYQLPLLYNKRYLKFGIILVIASYIFYLGSHLNHDFGIGRKLISWHKPHTISEILTSGEFYFRNCVNIYIVAFSTAIIKFLKDALESRSKIELLNKEMAQVQYTTIVSAIDTELVIDTLDTIIDKADSKLNDLPRTIAGLSSVLDDILHKAPADHFNLTDEIALINNFVDLHNIVYETHQVSRVDHLVRESSKPYRARTFQKPLSSLLKKLRSQLKSSLIELILIEEDDSLVLQLSIESPENINVARDSLLTDLADICGDKLEHELLNEDNQLIIKLSNRL